MFGRTLVLGNICVALTPNDGSYYVSNQRSYLDGSNYGFEKHLHRNCMVPTFGKRTRVRDSESAHQ